MVPLWKSNRLGQRVRKIRGIRSFQHSPQHSPVTEMKLSTIRDSPLDIHLARKIKSLSVILIHLSR
jgi:hypothetical protein